jgi:long-chain fatty acid transport protein
MRMAHADPELGGSNFPKSSDGVHLFGSLIGDFSHPKPRPRLRVRKQVHYWLLCCVRVLLIRVLFSLIFFIPTVSLAGGPIHGAKAAGMATAFLAVVDDPSAILYNPAGLVNLKGTQVYGGMTAVILSSEYVSPDGSKEKTSFQIFLPPHSYITSDFGLEKFVFGLGIFSPFGIGGRKWSQTGLTRYVSTDTLIGTVTINPSVTWRIRPQLSLGVGVDVLYALNRMTRMVNQSLFNTGDAELRFKGGGFGMGYNFGVLLFPGGKLSFAFAFRSDIRLKQWGDLVLENIAAPLQPIFGGNPFRTKAGMWVRFPQILSWGVAYRPATPWTIALDVEWVRWSSLDKSTLDLRKEVPSLGFTDIPISFKWHDSWQVKIGADYKLNDRFSLRGGYAFIESQVPASTLGPASPDANSHNFSLGLGVNLNCWVIDTFYILGFYPSRTVHNDILSGTYKNFVQYGGLSVGYKF